jgi:hypothetical protein
MLWRGLLTSTNDRNWCGQLLLASCSYTTNISIRVKQKCQLVLRSRETLSVPRSNAKQFIELSKGIKNVGFEIKTKPPSSLSNRERDPSVMNDRSPAPQERSGAFGRDSQRIVRSCRRTAIASPRHRERSRIRGAITTSASNHCLNSREPLTSSTTFTRPLQ